MGDSNITDQFLFRERKSVLELFRRICAEQGVSPQDVVRQLIREYCQAVGVNKTPPDQ